MSYSSQTKEELCRFEPDSVCCLLAELSGIVCAAGSVIYRGGGDKRLSIETENNAVARRAFRLLREVFDVQPQLVTLKRSRLGGRSAYRIEISGSEASFVLEGCGIEMGQRRGVPREITVRKCCRMSFLRGVFLACGSVTDPEKEYNIEFLSPRHSLSQQLEGILAQYEFNPHRAVRKGANTVYVKSSDHLEDLLTFMGAGNAAMRIMEQRMYNDMRNKTNRLSNCETANMGKTVQAAVQVRLAIEMLEEAGALETLPKPLQQAARLRMQYPEMPLAKLAEKFDPPVSKAGLSHRFKRIQEAAARLNAAASAQPEEQENLKEPEPAGQDIAPSPQ